MSISKDAPENLDSEDETTTTAETVNEMLRKDI